jgi:Flp pilus assembly protein TadG
MKPMRHEQGQVLVEFALTALIFFTMVVFVMDGSRIFWNYLTVSQAARVGARYATVHGALATSKVGPSNYAALTNEIQSRVVGLAPTNLTVTPTWAGNSNAPGSSVTVVVTYPVQPITRLFWPGQTFNLSAQSTMVIQN